MKKVININLAGKMYTIDDDAYAELNKYLNKLEKYFAKSQGTNDIIYDIEARIAELFDENSIGGPIVSISKVEKIKKIMGMPEEFETEENSKSSYGKEKPNMSKQSRKVRRFFRDPEDKWIGGVMSGLSAYFGFSNPIWLRILIVIITITTFGSLVAVYIVLWIVIPLATTSSDFLAMRGEEINIDNIAKTVEDGFNEIKDKVEDLGNEFRTKML
jgi:phage shock protein PspC (stress-responsive transcriptional regulator)